MIKKHFLEILPKNFRHETNFFINNNFDSWKKLNDLNEREINSIIQRNPLCTKSRIVKIKAVANFVLELEISPFQAYLLLHCGIGSTKALTLYNPHSLANKIGRLERSLKAKTKTPVDLNLINKWITTAKRINLK